MNTRDLIHSVATRLTALRRANLAISLIAPILSLAIYIVLSRSYTLPTAALSIFLLFSLGAFFYALARSRQLAQRATATDAASLLDTRLSGKERFLTIASIPDKQDETLPSINAVNAQASQLASSFDVLKALPFSLERQARYSVFATPPLLIVLLLLLWFSPSHPLTQNPAVATLSEESASNIRELINHTPNLPPAWRDNLEALASSIEEEGLLSDDVNEQLDDLLGRVEELQSQVEQPAEQNLSEQKQADGNSPSEEQEQNNSNQSSSADAHNDEAEQPQQSEGSSSAAPSPNQPPGEPSDKRDSPPEKSQEGSPDSAKQQGSGDKQQGEKGKEQSADNQSPNQSGQEQKQSGGNAPQEDEKKDVSGLGEGKGSSGGDSSKGLQGEGKQGGSEEGAKEGEAKHDAPGSKPGDSNDQPSAKQTEGKPNPSKQAAEQDGGKNSKGEKQGAGSSPEQLAKEMNDKVNSLNDKVKEATSPTPPSAKQQSESQSGSGEGAKQDPNNKQGQKTGKGEKDAKANEQTSNNDGAQNSSQQGTNPKDQGNDTPKDTGKQQGDKSPANREERNSDNKSPQDDQDSPRDALGGTKRSTGRPEPSDTARRFGPFAGGDKGEIDLGGVEKTKVGIPLEQNLVVHSLGGADNKLYKNKPGASAQTELGTSEFRKPEADVGELSQPIPVEYQDLMHDPVDR